MTACRKSFINSKTLLTDGANAWYVVGFSCHVLWRLAEVIVDHGDYMTGWKVENVVLQSTLSTNDVSIKVIGTKTIIMMDSLVFSELVIGLHSVIA